MSEHKYVVPDSQRPVSFTMAYQLSSSHQGQLSQSTLDNIPDSSENFRIEQYLKTSATDEPVVGVADSQERKASLERMIAQADETLLNR